MIDIHELIRTIEDDLNQLEAGDPQIVLLQEFISRLTYLIDRYGETASPSWDDMEMAQ